MHSVALWFALMFFPPSSYQRSFVHKIPRPLFFALKMFITSFTSTCNGLTSLLLFSRWLCCCRFLKKPFLSVSRCISNRPHWLSEMQFVALDTIPECCHLSSRQIPLRFFNARIQPVLVHSAQTHWFGTFSSALHTVPHGATMDDYRRKQNCAAITFAFLGKTTCAKIYECVLLSFNKNYILRNEEQQGNDMMMACDRSIV